VERAGCPFRKSSDVDRVVLVFIGACDRKNPDKTDQIPGCRVGKIRSHKTFNNPGQVKSGANRENKMDRKQIVELITEEITRLEHVRDLLSSSNGHGLVVSNGVKASRGPKKRVLSADARNRIAQAQKRRWAKQRKETQLAKKAS
jgi:hypothetical protein